MPIFAGGRDNLVGPWSGSLLFTHAEQRQFTSPPAILIYSPQVRSLCTSFRRSGAVHTSNERTGAALPPASVYFMARQAKGY